MKVATIGEIVEVFAWLPLMWGVHMTRTNFEFWNLTLAGQW